MSQERLGNRLHLPSLSIKGFRGIDELTIDRLGRVTLIAGKNSVGKTTVLDAIQVYAARGHYNILSQLLTSRQEVSIATAMKNLSDNLRKFVADLPALFHGRDVSKCARIAIGPKSDTDQLRIEEIFLNENTGTRVEGTLYPHVLRGYTQAFRVVFEDTAQMLPWILPIQGSDAARTVERYSVSACLYSQNLLLDAKWSSPIGCQFLGPGLLSDEEIVRSWNAIALTEDEDRAVQALKLIFGNDLERVAVRRDEISDTEHVQRVVARLRGQTRPVPLQSLGDGALHLSGVALALTNSRDGFLLIDEAENGIHHSVQRDYWRMVFETAQANNVQVLATTHSFDCLRGFAQAMTDCGEADGALVRLEQENGTLRAVEYSERNIKAAAKQRIDIEMR